MVYFPNASCVRATSALRASIFFCLLVRSLIYLAHPHARGREASLRLAPISPPPALQTQFEQNLLLTLVHSDARAAYARRPFPIRVATMFRPLLPPSPWQYSPSPRARH